MSPKTGYTFIMSNIGSSKEKFAHLRETLNRLPAKPGVYLMKDKNGIILYVGKAKSLRDRVRSYFQSCAAHSPRIEAMTAKARSVDVVITASEIEALILEDNLIKKEKPTFNVLLKDDKNYPYLKLTMKEKFPRLILARKVLKDGGIYFGPYVSAKSVRDTLRLVRKIFPLRQSRDNLEGKPFRRPCLNYQMKRCLAPCAGKVSEEQYRSEVDQVIMFLKGHNEELIKTLHQKMMDASGAEFFEVAARYRDEISALNKLAEKQSITDTSLADEDVIASYERAGRSIMKIFRIKRGKMNAEKNFLFDKLDILDRDEALGAFIRQFYSHGMEIPGSIIINGAPDDKAALEEYLSARKGAKVKIVFPLRGRKRRLMEMAEKNAKLQLTYALDSEKERREALEEIRDKLSLTNPPTVIEAYDISNTAGLNPVGSVVVFRDGSPSKSEYRKYQIKSVTGPDDYASLAEVARRRVTRLAEKGQPIADLILIDGGKGQVSVIDRELKEMGVNCTAIVGIAKGKDREDPESDEFYVPHVKEEVKFAPQSPGRFLLQRARDEAHRFAVSYHRKLRDSAMTRSSLDAIPGIGPKRKKALLKRFGSVRKIREAPLEELKKTLRVSDRVAKSIYEKL
ncbi:Excinuclease ABC subunit C [hydrothermal vent metagenome]|uniref:Excinuclease ABC subunit C n=1 Tax=hydrothermal vent metagenome TaxID=652676 RepID=A0A3B1BBH9_9ZZZZ